MRLVSTVHGWIANTSRERWYRIVDKWALRFYDEVVCVSEKLREECLQSGVKAASCCYIPNGIDTLEFQRKLTRSEAKTQLGVDCEALLLGAVGRLSDEKGFEFLVEAADVLSGSGRNVVLWIAGEGPARPKLERQIAASGYGDRIRLLGHIRDPAVFFQAMDIYVLSSLSEGLPNAVLEAMAFATPVVATTVGGLPSLIEQGQSGILIPPGNCDELVQALMLMTDDATLRERVGLAGRRTVETSFSLEGRMRKMCSVYDKLRFPRLAIAPVKRAKDAIT